MIAVTGASSGIGWELSKKLAADGAKVALIARRVDRLRQLESEIVDAGGIGCSFACDLSDPAAVAELPARVTEGLGEVSVLVNNAGRGAHGAFDEVALDIHRQVLQTNLESLIGTTYAFLPPMLKRRQGQLVFVSSVLGRLPAPEHAVYAASKWGVSGFAESLSYELGPRGIDVVLVEPGLVRSEFAEHSSTPLARYQRVPSKSSAEAADEVRWAMRRNCRHHIADRTIALVISAKRHAPRVFRRVFSAMYGRAKKV